MKNIFEIMKEYGLEVPEDKQKDFEKAVLENYKTVADYNTQAGKLKAANDTIIANDTAIGELKKQLEGFKDVDVTGLNDTITKLEKEKQTMKEEYEKSISDRDFNDLLKESIASANGKNVKAITALLEVDELKASKNQKEDIANAIKALTEAEDSKMLFGTSEPEAAGRLDITGRIGGGSVDALEASMRAAMGLEVKEGDK